MKEYVSNLKNEPVSVSILWEIGDEFNKIKKELEKEEDILINEYRMMNFVDKMPTALDIRFIQGQIVAYGKVLDVLYPFVFRDKDLENMVKEFVTQVEELANDFEIDITLKTEYGEDEDTWFVGHNVENIKEKHPIFDKMISKLLYKMFFSKRMTDICFYYDCEL